MKIPLKETLIAGICVIILCGLGTWQMQRLHWKDAIIADLQESYTREADTNLADGLIDVVERQERHFAYGSISAHLLKDKAILLGPRILDGRSGYHLLIPATVNGEALYINMGWVSDLWNDTLDERLGTMPTDITARGLLRWPDWSSFTSKNSPDNNLWFRPDTAEIAKAKELGKTYKAILYADKIDPPLQDVVIHEEKWLPRNKHLQYAIFWYALAAVMLAVYCVYVKGRNHAS